MALDETLCWIIRDGKETLLMKRASTEIGEGKWSGPGGKVEKGETPVQCAVREVFEETGLTVKPEDLREHGVVRFHIKGRQEVGIVGYIFSARRFSGKVGASEEGELAWFPIKDMPWNEMFAGDVHWAPRILRDENAVLDGDIYYDEDWKVAKQSIKIDSGVKH